MNHRLTIAAAVAVILASVSEIVLINGGSWLAATIGAVIVIALAGHADQDGAEPPGDRRDRHWP